MGIWVGQEQKGFKNVIAAFNKQYPKVHVNYNAVGDNLPTVLSTAVAGGNPPDLAAVAQPGLMQSLVQQNKLKPLDYLQSDASDNFSQSTIDAGSVNGTFYGLLWKVNNKSTVFYNVKAFNDAGVSAPSDWDTFLKNAQTIKQSGVDAYSIGGSDGWTLTDLFENIYLRTAGPDKYDQLTLHKIKWTDPSVKTALGEMAKILGDSANIAGGTSGALQTDFPTSVSNVLSEKPKAAMVIEGDFVPGVVETTLKPVTGYNEFAFPSINGSPQEIVGGGNLVVTFRDTPAIEAFMKFLTSADSAKAWISTVGGFSSANKNVPLSAYKDPILKRTSQSLTQAQTFKFDMSDQEPASFGATTGQGEWKIFQDFLQNPKDINGTAQALESAAAKAFKSQ
jgi:hypothetical protein